MATFKNLYYKRAVGTARACYVCYRPTTVVLSTLGNTDFIYACETHLTDPGFATLVTPSAEVKPALSESEIRKVKEEWEAKQAKKREKEKETEKEKEKEKADAKEKGKEKAATGTKPTPPPVAPIAGVPTATSIAGPKHEQYLLHRQIFAMRQAEHRKRKQVNQAKEIAPKLPIAPRNILPQI